jgi:hypothetical protein
VSGGTDGRLAFGITGDLETAPELDVLAGAIAAGVADLAAMARSR